jgi:hypothetical protein
MKKLLTICLMLLGAVAQAQNFAITATTEAAIRKNVVRGNAANYGFGMINDTLRLIGLNTRYDISSGSFSKNTVGLGNVDNTSDANKPISTATQTALNLKANIASPTFTGTVSGITKSMVGLGNIDNTTDAAKPISTATQTALDAKQATLNGTGFVKSSAGTISYDNSTYLSASTASSTYLPINNPTATGTLTAPTIANSLGANFATTSGSVGIGITPSYKLHVSGGNIYVGGAGAGIRIEDRSLATRSFQLYVDGGAFAFFNHNNSTQPVTITDGGNFGIGTIAPASKLHISGAGDNTIKINSTATNNPYLNLTLQNTGSTPYGILEAGDGVAYRALALNPTSGNVGIGTGTTAPAYKLDVNGTARVTGNVSIGTTLNTRTLQVHTTTNNVNLESANTTTTGTNYSLSSFAFGVGATLNVGALFQASGATSNYGIRVFNVAASANNYAIYSDSPAQSYFQGTVGIGTTTPAASAVLDITSTTQGVLFPRLTTTQINAITSPANGLTVYNTTLSVLCFYDGTTWKKVSHSAM